ncbi:hypothetical protein BRARA_B03547 [Brassica rapa]|uniref:GRF-type domain-containing protein n=1 Tax=Brassica campestris TaxID=3711 RepID=A0A398AFL7_BRACM|nr:hypothetical protein BRARA_B03547 [Brassica rapa]
MDLGRGIPRRCDCGAATIVLTSSTARNPGRRFYRCGAISGQNHVFKWVDEAHEEEFVVMANKLATMEQDLADIKSDLADMKNDISEIVALIECLRVKYYVVVYDFSNYVVVNDGSVVVVSDFCDVV